jgi:CubicO group peptidase (beta-lactamase class C family)
MTKSVINALIGILVREGRLAVDTPAPVPEWRDVDDLRHPITIDELMRMTSGLALEEWDTGFDPATHMLYLAPDMAAFAQGARLKAPPGSKWEYTSGNTLILSRILRDAVGGGPGDVLRFAQHELFQPLGIRNVTLEFDGAGTPIGSTYLYASARDWARFGLLYLNDGVVGGLRILPEGWVRYSTTPSIRRGYGAGWWTNREPSGEPLQHSRLGLQGDAYWTAGALGQRVLVIPSERLVIVRLGVSREQRGVDVPGMAQLATDIIAALPHKGEQRQ